jgi:hypothetical protein
MSKPSRCTVFLFIAHYFASCLAQTPQNITIDDNNPAIIYTGNWNTSDPSNLDYGGSHKLTDDNVSNAKFQFTGASLTVDTIFLFKTYGVGRRCCLFHVPLMALCRVHAATA